MNQQLLCYPIIKFILNGHYDLLQFNYLRKLYHLIQARFPKSYNWKPSFLSILIKSKNMILAQMLILIIIRNYHN